MRRSPACRLRIGAARFVLHAHFAAQVPRPEKLDEGRFAMLQSRSSEGLGPSQVPTRLENQYAFLPCNTVKAVRAMIFKSNASDQFLR
jgi:hypothetical protein